mmetsp:Transcript_14647/g.25015  ORF Transcript_14647/g.25015 Transcript_14647/m.25015 type:complete len:228 (+) Transcript_14647:402-1085(+)
MTSMTLLMNLPTMNLAMTSMLPRNSFSAKLPRELTTRLLTMTLKTLTRKTQRRPRRKASRLLYPRRQFRPKDEKTLRTPLSLSLCISAFPETALQDSKRLLKLDPPPPQPTSVLFRCLTRQFRLRVNLSQKDRTFAGIISITSVKKVVEATRPSSRQVLVQQIRLRFEQFLDFPVGSRSASLISLPFSNHWQRPASRDFEVFWRCLFITSQLASRASPFRILNVYIF